MQRLYRVLCRKLYRKVCIQIWRDLGGGILVKGAGVHRLSWVVSNGVAG